MDCHLEMEQPPIYSYFLVASYEEHSVKTKKFLFKMHIITDIQCPRCGYAVENVLHVLRDSLHAKKMWCLLLPSTCRDEFFNISLALYFCCGSLEAVALREPSPFFE